MSTTVPSIHPPAPDQELEPILLGPEAVALHGNGAANACSEETGETADKNPQASPLERRSTFPGMEAHRRLFAKIERIVRRYSIDPLAKNAQGEYITNLDTVQQMLEGEIDELSNADALIPLLRILKGEEWNLHEGDKRIGAYRLVSPTIKQLNDYYLGPNQTDDYIEELHLKIEEILGQNNAKVLKSHFKGGIFIIDVDRIDGTGNDDHKKAKVDVLEEKLGEIQQVARDVLLTHMKKRRMLLEKKHSAKSTERVKVSQDMEELNGSAPKDSEERIRTLSKEIRKLDENIEELERVTRMILSGEMGIDIAIGMDKLKDGPINNYLAIRNAECAANIATLQKLDPDVLNGNGKKPGVPFVYMREYDHKELLKHLIKAQYNLSSVLNEEMSDILDEWKPFFTMDNSGYVRMNPEMINIYRHMEKHRKSDGYLAMTPKEKEDFEKKIAFFDRYYKTVNIVDFLKNFQSSGIDQYLSEIYRIVALVSEAERLLEDPKANEGKIRKLLQHTSQALEVSLKNDSPLEERVKTNRAAIKAMMEPGLKVKIFGDNIGFGAINQSAFEQCAIELISMLNISRAEWNEITGEDGKINKAKLDEVLSRKLDQIHESPAFVQKMLSFDDQGTKYLRGIEEKLYRLLGGSPVIDADGGDETRAVFTEQNVPGLKEKLHDPKHQLLQFSVDQNIRIAAQIDESTIEPITTERITEDVRRQILRLIWTMEEADAAHTEIKAYNARGEHRIIIIPSGPQSAHA